MGDVYVLKAYAKTKDLLDTLDYILTSFLEWYG